ncbi:MAG: 2-C-methyl-D-erythritol 4-phosphate cytidylyltransferase [Propionibacteriales bacterium]|nr:2-C-methyl-D-erythritol 4-phosphate cytidylyltransferase [Propionibacteriales bacterium]
MGDRVAAVIPAAGVGSRLGTATGTAEPKALRLLGGRSLLQWSVDPLSPLVDQLAVAVAPPYVVTTREMLSEARPTVTVMPGGSTRQDSVRVCLAQIDLDVSIVLVHDTARPLVPPAVVQRVLAALRAGAEAVVPVVPVIDSLRRTRRGADDGSLDRDTVRAVQTPQGFQKDLLLRAHATAAGRDLPDDASMVEQLGIAVTQVAGSELSFKVTRPLDLVLAEAVVAERTAAVQQ